LGSGVWGLGPGIWGLGFGVWSLGYVVWGVDFGFWGMGIGVWVWGLGLRHPRQIVEPWPRTAVITCGAFKHATGAAGPGGWVLGFKVWDLGYGVLGVGF